MSRLDDIKARISVPLPELEVRVTDNLRWADVTPKDEPDGATHRIARCADDEHAELIAHAPADLAALVAVVEGVQRVRDTMLAEELEWEYPERRYVRMLDDALRPVTEEGQK